MQMIKIRYLVDLFLTLATKDKSDYGRLYGLKKVHLALSFIFAYVKYIYITTVCTLV